MGNVEAVRRWIPSQSRVCAGGRRYREAMARFRLQEKRPVQVSTGALLGSPVGLDTDGRGEADAGAGVRAD